MENRDQYVDVCVGFRHKHYLVKRSDLENKENKILLLPDGIAIDLTQTFVETQDKHGNLLEVPSLGGSNSEYRVWGTLSIFQVLTVTEEALRA